MTPGSSIPGAGQDRTGTDRSAPAPVRVSVVIPAFNEEEILEQTIREGVEVLESIPGEHEILAVDDGSVDGTWDVMCRVADAQPMFRPLRHARNLGIAKAQETLVGAACGEFIFHIGADREWNMSELHAMLDTIETGYDIVIGVRRDKQYTRWRKLASTSFNVLVAVLWGKHFGDLGSLKLARSSIWKQIPFGARSAFINAERVLIAHANGARITTVPVDHFRRQTGESKFASPLQSARALRDLVRFRLSPRSRYRIDR